MPRFPLWDWATHFSSSWKVSLLTAQSWASSHDWPNGWLLKGASLPKVMPFPNERKVQSPHPDSQNTYTLCHNSRHLCRVIPTSQLPLGSAEAAAVTSTAVCLHLVPTLLSPPPYRCFPKSTPQQITFWLRICFLGNPPRKLDTRIVLGSWL